MNILILGSGGREHSLAWAIKQNPKCDNIFVAPGNAGIAQLAKCINVDILNATQIVSTVKAVSYTHLTLPTICSV